MSAQNQATSNPANQPSPKTTKDKPVKSRWSRLRKQVDKLTGKKESATRVTTRTETRQEKRPEPLPDPEPPQNPGKEESGNDEVEDMKANDDASSGVSSEDIKSSTSDSQRIFTVSETQEWIFAVQPPLYRTTVTIASGATPIDATLTDATLEKADDQYTLDSGSDVQDCVSVVQSGTSAVLDSTSVVPDGTDAVPHSTSVVPHSEPAEPERTKSQPKRRRSGAAMIGAPLQVYSAVSPERDTNGDSPMTQPCTSDGAISDISAMSRSCVQSQVQTPDSATVQTEVGVALTEDAPVHIPTDSYTVQIALGGATVQSDDESSPQLEGARLAAALCKVTLLSSGEDIGANVQSPLENDVFEMVPDSSGDDSDVQIALNGVMVQVAPDGALMESTDIQPDGTVVHRTASYLASMEIAPDGALVLMDDGASKEAPLSAPSAPGQSNNSVDKTTDPNIDLTAVDTGPQSMGYFNDDPDTNLTSIDAHKTPTHNPLGIVEAKKHIDSATFADTPETASENPLVVLQCGYESSSGTIIHNTTDSARPSRPKGIHGEADLGSSPHLNNKWHSLQNLDHGRHKRTPSNASLSGVANTNTDDGTSVPFYQIGSAGRWSHRDLSRNCTKQNSQNSPKLHGKSRPTDGGELSNSDMDLSHLKPTARRFFHNVFVRSNTSPDMADKLPVDTENKPDSKQKVSVTPVTRRKSFVQRLLHRKDGSNINAARQNRQLQKQQQLLDAERKQQVGNKSTQSAQSDNRLGDKGQSLSVSGEKHHRKLSITKDRPPSTSRYGISRMFSKWKSLSDISTVSGANGSAKETSTPPTARKPTKETQQKDAQLSTTWRSQNDLTPVARNSGTRVGAAAKPKGRRHSEWVKPMMSPHHRARTTNDALGIPDFLDVTPGGGLVNNKQAGQTENIWATEYSCSLQKPPPEPVDDSYQPLKRLPKMPDPPTADASQNDQKKKKPNRLNRVFARRKTVSEIPNIMLLKAAQTISPPTTENVKTKPQRKSSVSMLSAPIGDESQTYLNGFDDTEQSSETGLGSQATQMSDDENDGKEMEYTFDDSPDARIQRISVVAELPTRPIQVLQDRLERPHKKVGGMMRRHSTIVLSPAASAKLSKKQPGYSPTTDKVGKFFLCVTKLY